MFFQDLRRKRRGSASTEAHHQHWIVCDLKKSPQTTQTREKTLPLTTSVSPSKVVLNPPSNLLTLHQRQQNSKDSDRPTQLERRETSLKKRSLADLLSKLQSVRSHSFSCISSHHNLLLCHIPSTVREDIPCCGNNNPATKPHEFPGTTSPGPCGSPQPPSQVPNLPGRVKSFLLTGLAPRSIESKAFDVVFALLRRRRAFASTPSSQSGLLGQPYLHMSPISVDCLPLDPSSPSAAKKRFKPISAHALERFRRDTGIWQRLM